MKQLFEMKEVLDSWRRCMEKGILHTVTSPAINLENNARVSRMKENVLLPIFDECLGKIMDFITDGYLFLLVDGDGVILKKTIEIRKKQTISILARVALSLRRVLEPMRLLFA